MMATDTRAVWMRSLAAVRARFLDIAHREPESAVVALRQQARPFLCLHPGGNLELETGVVHVDIPVGVSVGSDGACRLTA